MKDYRKTKARFFLKVSALRAFTFLRISWIIYGALTKEVSPGEYKSSLASSVARIVFGALFLLLGIAYIIDSIVLYFKKPARKIKEKEKTDQAPYRSYQELKEGRSLSYKDYFVGNRREEKKNLLSLSLSCFYLLLAAIALLVNPKRRKHSGFFYTILVLFLLLFAFGLLYLFLLPTIRLKKDRKTKKEETIEIVTPSLIVKSKERVVSYDFDYRDDAKETKDSFLFVFLTHDGLLLTVKKEGREEETKRFLSEKTKEIRKRRRPY